MVRLAPGCAAARDRRSARRFTADAASRNFSLPRRRMDRQVCLGNAQPREAQGRLPASVQPWGSVATQELSSYLLWERCNYRARVRPGRVFAGRMRFPDMSGLSSDDRLLEQPPYRGSGIAEALSQVNWLMSAPGGIRTPVPLLRSYPRPSAVATSENPRVLLPTPGS